MKSLLLPTVALVITLLAASTLVSAIPEGTVLDSTVPLTHCAVFGGDAGFQLEWELNQEPKNTFEMRFTADNQRGRFNSFGFIEFPGRVQIVSGYPAEKLACARTLFDTSSPFDVNGNVYPNHPELPGNIVTANDTHSVHYAMRNLTTSARDLKFQGHQMNINVTILWSFMQASLFNAGCYGGDVTQTSEWATFSIPLASNDYARTSNNGLCTPYAGRLDMIRMPSRNNVTMGEILDVELNQNRRVLALLVGGSQLLESGNNPPVFDSVNGRIFGGEDGNGVCQQNLNTIYARWSGFSDPIGGIKEYLVSLGTQRLPSLYVDRTSAGTNEALQYTYSDGLTPNSTLYVTVQAINYAGLITEIQSKPIRVLNGGAPYQGYVNDGPLGGGDLEFQTALTFTAHWGGWRRHEFASINHDTEAYTENSAEIAIGTGGSGSLLNDVLDWTTISGAFAFGHSVTSGFLQTIAHGNTYYWSVRARSCSGQYTMQTSNGVTIDRAPPQPGVIRYGNSTFRHTSTAHNSELIQANWAGFVDTTSSIAYYEWAMGKANPWNGDSGNIAPWTNVGTATTIGLSGKRLHEYVAGGLNEEDTFYIYVRAVDVVGNFVIITSNATTVLKP